MSIYVVRIDNDPTHMFGMGNGGMGVTLDLTWTDSGRQDGRVRKERKERKEKKEREGRNELDCMNMMHHLRVRLLTLIQG